MTDKQAIWAEVIESAKREQEEKKLKPDEITVRQFADKTGSTMAQAREYLNKLVDEGKAVKRYIGNNTVAYKLVNGQ